MKKVILLFVAVMISSVLWAQENVYGDATVSQVGNYNKALVDQTQASGGGWDMAYGSGTDATVQVNGDYNQTYIKQVGQKNVAGQDIHVTSFDVCAGFSAMNTGEKFGRYQSLYMGPEGSTIELACGEMIPFMTFALDLPKIYPGIYISGDENITSISQDGSHMLAGITVSGDRNRAGIYQVNGEWSKAGVSIAGNDNKAIVKQDGDEATAYVDINGDNNAVGVNQRSGLNNRAIAEVEGNGNQVFADQNGDLNISVQGVTGNNNNVLLEQVGHHNGSVQMTSGSNHNSWVYQNGSENRSIVLQ
ncbi:hypothetical protein [Prolixibacter sp. SD074]|uniref:hypothetical protein n=1 Tax=Prolixibacter sp. SD074 TaxID=2652391 RepID=UPI00126E9EB6|nr:hypothetical protein [Prolixibacter sp. SD074]GET28615.1 hypothetical protein SD074_08170 [Prolixibacter sp. SD074]